MNYLRKNNGKKRYMYVFLIVIMSAIVSVGYAFLNRTLVINGVSEIEKNTWKIAFENVVVTVGSIEVETPPTIKSNSPEIGFKLRLKNPGEYYEFTLDVVNKGTIDAMIENLEKTPTLNETQQKYLNYTIEYQNGEQITEKQILKKEEFVRIKVRVEFKKDVTEEDLPAEADSLNLGFILNYVQSDESAIEVKDNGVGNRLIEFIVNGSVRYTEEGMTWSDFLDSEYNIDDEFYYHSQPAGIYSRKFTGRIVNEDGTLINGAQVIKNGDIYIIG